MVLLVDRTIAINTCSIATGPLLAFAEQDLADFLVGSLWSVDEDGIESTSNDVNAFAHNSIGALWGALFALADLLVEFGEFAFCMASHISQGATVADCP